MRLPTLVFCTCLGLVAGCSFLVSDKDYTFDPDSGRPDTGVDAASDSGRDSGTDAFNECTTNDECSQRANVSVECQAGTCVDLGCVDGFGDCDGIESNGCEVDINADLRHCGACDAVCAYPQASAACNAGSCVINACNEFFENCDGTVDNGCEADLRSAGACGRCGNVCQGSTPICDSSTGSAACVESCTGDAALCGSVCVDTTMDVRHCNMCDNACDEPDQSSPVCSAPGGTPMCSFLCDADYGDCNMTATDGCERDLRTDLDHCGMCGNACEGNNAVWSCADSSCVAVDCLTGFEDCDGDNAGCEIDVLTDSSHCGGCNQLCDGTCVDGVCDPFVGGDGGRTITCLRRLSGKTYCFGASGWGQIPGSYLAWNTATEILRGDASPFLSRAVQAGRQTICAIAVDATNDGRVFCWGQRFRGQTGQEHPANNSPSYTEVPEAVVAAAGTSGFSDRTFVQLAAGDRLMCGRDDIGGIWCWGENRSADLFPDLALNIETAARPITLPGPAIDIAMGDYNICATIQGGNVYCWGNFNGLGTGATANTNTPTLVPALTNIERVDMGDRAGCAVDTNADLYCWGLNNYGQLGVGDLNPRPTPELVLSEVTDFVFNARGACARRVDESVHCWGEQKNGIAASGVLDLDGSVLTPTRVDDIAGNEELASTTELIDGDFHFCGLHPVTPVCWGSNRFGQLGNRNDLTIGPQPVATTVELADGSSAGGLEGDGSGCVMERGGMGRLFCFGETTTSILGPSTANSTREGESVPTLIPMLDGVTHVGTGPGFRCVLRSGTPWCWGGDASGRCGQDGTSTIAVPTAVPVPAGFIAVDLAVANGHVLTTRDDNTVWSWGSNIDDKRGHPTDLAPAQVVGLPAGVVSGLAASQRASAAIVDGLVFWWGFQVASGSSPSPTELRAEGDTVFDNVLAIDGGRFHHCGIRDTAPLGDGQGQAYCWGDGDSFRLGTASNLDAGEATPVVGLSDAVSIAAGRRHSCAVRANGEVVCWGSNNNGELGVPGPDSEIAITVPGVTGATRVRAGTFGGMRTLAFQADGTALCWGDNLAGACGNGQPVRFPSPEPVFLP